MSARTSGWRPPPIFTTTWITFALIVTALGGLLLLAALAGLGGGWVMLGYLGFVVVTAWTLRGVREEAGSWLGRFAGPWSSHCSPAARRSSRPGPARSRSWWRSSCCRTSRWAGRRCGWRARPTRSWTSGLSGRLLVAIAELAVMLPTMAVAWSARNGGGRWTPLPGLAVPVLGAVWLLAIAWTPVQAAAVSRNFGVSGPAAVGSTCGHFVAGRIVGGGFGATVGMRVEVCWNGRSAFVVGDPAIPLPPGVVGDQGARFLTACGADDVEDFAAVSGRSCTATVDAQGTLHYTVRARVLPLALPIGARDVTMELVVTRDGRVLSRP
jgi:hypothetical protein